MRVFLKNMRKSWFNGIATPLAVTIFVPMITAIWPEFKTQASSFMELLKNPIYKAMLGDLINADIGTWQGFFYMYIFMWMQFVLLFVTIFVPARLITNEVDKFLDENKDGRRLILLDGLEYLIAQNGFGKVLKLLNHLRDMMGVSNGTLLVPFDMKSVEEKEAAMLKADLEVV